MCNFYIFFLMFIIILNPRPADWVGQPGHSLVLFEIWTIFTSIQQKKKNENKTKFAKLKTKNLLQCAKDFKIGGYNYENALVAFKARGF